MDACPVERPDEFNCGMSTTKAIYLPFEMAYPLQYVIDAAVCPGTECGKCVPACPYEAIDLEMQPETIEVEVAGGDLGDRLGALRRGEDRGPGVRHATPT